MTRNYLRITATLLALAPAAGSWAAAPDFNDSAAVLKNMRAMLDQCSNARAKSCMVSCGYGLKTLKNFIKANPGGDPSIMKQRWEPCFEAHRDANIKVAAPAEKDSAPPVPAPAKAAPSYDRSKFVISNLQLGGSMEPQKGRCRLLEAYGHHNETKAEHWDSVIEKGAATGPGPDIVKGYKGLINEAPVYIHFEADAAGRLYMIQFRQKEKMNVEPVKQALIDRYGQPSKQHGSYIYWGCERGPQDGFCVKASATENILEIWAFDAEIKKAAELAYEANLLKAKGIKAGPKF